MKKSYAVCGLGNAIVDILLDVDDQEFASLGFTRGTMELVDAPTQRELIERFEREDRQLVLASGGSVANSTIAISQLGGEAAFIGIVGDDRYGMHYAQEFELLRIDIGNPILVGEHTATCLALITPDAERTMRTALAVSGELDANHVDERRIAESEWLFIEGYLFANPKGLSAIVRAIELAQLHETRVAITASDAFIPEVFGDSFRSALEKADLLFCNAGEARAITGTRDARTAWLRLQEMLPAVVVTDGANGAWVAVNGEAFHQPATPCKPVDLTGAGDMFAGAFLYGLSHHKPLRRTAAAANALCAAVITQVGARLHHGTREIWDASMGD